MVVRENRRPDLCKLMVPSDVIAFAVLIHCAVQCFTMCFKHQRNTMHYIFKQNNNKKKNIYGSSCDRGRFMKKFCFDTISNITLEPQELHRYRQLCLWGH